MIVRSASPKRIVGMLAGTIINDERQRVGCTRLGEGNLVGIAVPYGGAGDLVEVADLQGDEAVVATGNQRTIAGLSHLIAVADLLGAPEIVLALDAHLRVVGIARLRDADGVVIGVADNAIAANTDADAAELAGTANCFSSRFSNRFAHEARIISLAMRAVMPRKERHPALREDAVLFLCVEVCVRTPIHRA